MSRYHSISAWIALHLGAVAFGAEDLPAKHVGAGYFSLALTGGELSAPRQTSTTDLELFSGVGLALAGGRSIGRFRIEGEFHFHDSQRMFTGDSVSFRTLMLNGYADFRLGRRWSAFVGAGAGLCIVEVSIDTCLDLDGCPTDGTVDDGTSTMGYQYMFGVTWSPKPRRTFFLGFRELRSEDLGLSDATGRAFVEDHLRAPMALLGITWKFRARR